MYAASIQKNAFPQHFMLLRGEKNTNSLTLILLSKMGSVLVESLFSAAEYVLNSKRARTWFALFVTIMKLLPISDH